MTPVDEVGPRAVAFRLRIERDDTTEGVLHRDKVPGGVTGLGDGQTADEVELAQVLQRHLPTTVTDGLESQPPPRVVEREHGGFGPRANIDTGRVRPRLRII